MFKSVNTMLSRKTFFIQLLLAPVFFRKYDKKRFQACLDLQRKLRPWTADMSINHAAVCRGSHFRLRPNKQKRSFTHREGTSARASQGFWGTMEHYHLLLGNKGYLKKDFKFTRVVYREYWNLGQFRSPVGW